MKIQKKENPIEARSQNTAYGGQMNEPFKDNIGTIQKGCPN